MDDATLSSPVKSRRRLEHSHSSGLQLELLSPIATSDDPLDLSEPLPGSHHSRNQKPIPSSARKIASGKKEFLSKQWRKWQRRIPFLKKIQETVLRVPPKLRTAFVVFWFGWKIALILILLFMTLQQPSSSMELSYSNNIRPSQFHNNMHSNATRVLYIVTSLAEYNNGRRKTVKGSDRFLHQLLPVMIDSVESMVSHNLQVDVVLICAYPLRPERETMIRYRLPRDVGLQIWDDALPLSYHPQNKTTGSLRANTRALARQHRFVVKDKLEYYDMFVAFEDDMLIRGHQVQHYWHMSQEIERLRIMAPESIKDGLGDNVDDYKHTKFFGTMSKSQLERVVPGFMRVEVLVNDTERTAKTKIQFPADWDFGDYGTRHIDPSICCHFHMEPPPLQDDTFPEAPGVDDLIIWETNIKAFSLRQFPTGSSPLLEWSVLMMGPGKKLPDHAKIGGYWSGRGGSFGDEKRPSGGEPKLVAQQGGWMATKEQLVRMNGQLCLAEFLPPFDRIAGGNDGLDPHNVEFWSGSYQFFTGAGNHCNMQRIISINPDHFSKHLLYHTANNKQKQLGQWRMLRADQLFGQLNSVKKMAEKAKVEIETSNSNKS
ncbi:hypothetical protein IV203_019721 [Nitzschia inconspicua]|uniref:Uncharacterized protein n=1 Tax=Nitzschia inconspicua TaxID=303405 RepID=A0A9K3M1G2_9STRA|nr:hypothetical protein IV203_019721 [Nitzschia inconspicua]